MGGLTLHLFFIINRCNDSETRMKFGNYLVEKRVDTTQNASVTELFPALAFNNKYRPSTVEDFKKFLYKLNLKSGKSKESFA